MVNRMIRKGEKSSNTMMLSNLMLHCDNLEDFKNDIYKNLEGQKERWSKKICEILESNNYSQAKLAQMCGVSKASVLKWVRGSVPQNREMFIRIGFAAGYDLKEMNKFLQRYGRYPELYPKCMEDSVYIFVLNSEVIEHTYESCKIIFDRISKCFESEEKISSERIETVLVMEKLLSLREVNELKIFLEDNSAAFKSSFDKLYEYVKAFVRNNNSVYVDADNPDSVNLLADTLNWSSSLRKCVYAIYKGTWFPLRSKVISLGVHLNMNLDEINEMLRLSKMEPLYIMNPVECIYIYALSDAELNDVIYEGTDELFQYVSEVFRDMGYDEEDAYGL